MQRHSPSRGRIKGPAVDETAPVFTTERSPDIF